MALFKCKMCGGTLEINNQESVATCEYCGMQQTLPKLDDDRRANLYDRANHFRRNNEFDKAMGIYEQILNEDGTDAEAYWSLVLCRYGIEYVEDPSSHKRMPTVNRAQFTSIYEDSNYKSALQYADGAQRHLYEEEAKAINEIQKGILAISEKEEPFDVFICYKESDNSGRRTPDSVLAQDLYYQLNQEGFKVFFARITLEDKIGSAYEPYIFAALNSAKVMVVLGTKPEHFNAVWVKNEWSRYLSLIKSGAKKTLIPAYRDMDPYDLPEEFSHLQAQDMSKLGFMQDLIRGIKKITEAEQPKETVVKETVVTAGTASVTSFLKRAFLFLEDEDWDNADEYCERVLDIDPENAEAYLGKLMVDLNVCKREQLNEQEEPFEENSNYQKALRFADEELRAFLTKQNEDINTRKENAYWEMKYQAACNYTRFANTEETCQKAAKFFEEIGDYKDSAALAEKYLEMAEAIRKDSILSAGKEAMAKDIIAYCERAVEQFESISGWKDADDLREQCLLKIEELKIKAEQDRLEEEHRREVQRKAAQERAKVLKKLVIIGVAAIAVIVAVVILLNAVIIPNKKYNDAVALMEQGEYEEARDILEVLGGYGSSEGKMAIINAIYMAERGQFDLAIEEVLEAKERIRIEYDLNGGESAQGNSFTYSSIEEYTSLLKPEKEGYRLAEWRLKGCNYSEKESLELNLIAVWSDEFSITYHLNDGEAENPSYYKKDGKAITLHNPTRKGYSFIGWTGTDLDDLSMEVVIPAGSYGDREYTANWEADGKITYHLNGGTAKNTTTYTRYDGSFKLSNPTREGYTFLGWTGTGLDGLTMEVTIPAGSHGDREYTANWEAHGKITYHLDGGTATNKTTYTHLEDAFTLKNPTKKGYTFLGWTGTGLDGLTMEVTVPAGSHGDREYTANWEGNDYTVSLKSNGGTVSQTSVNVTFGASCTLPTPTKAHYTFQGWYDGTTKYESGKWNTAKNVTLTAKWTPIEYEINYDLAGGKNSSKNVTSYTIESAKITLNNPTREGYKFLGWYSDKDYKNKVTQIATDSQKDMNLYAKWEVIEYKISYDLNGGIISGTKKATFTVEDLPLSLPTPTRVECDFLGWKKNNFDGEEVIKITKCGDITLYADFLNSNLRFYTAYSDKYEVIGYEVASYNSYYGGEATVIDIPAKYKGLPVVKIGSGAFKNVDNIQIVNLPDTIETIGNYAFRDAKNINIVNLPDGLKEIGHEAFYGCSSLTNISIPHGVTKIGRDCFANCYELKEILIPETVSSIGAAAFEDCSSLIEITIPDGVTVIESYTFSGCSGLKEVSLSESLTTINWNAFENCTSLSAISLPEGLNYLGSNAFAGCIQLQSITIPGTVKELSEYLFWGCTNLSTVILNEGLETIESYVFTSEKLLKLIIPKSVNKIRYNAFEGYGGYPSCSNIVFCCRATEEPPGFGYGWSRQWTVIWGYTGN